MVVRELKTMESLKTGSMLNEVKQNVNTFVSRDKRKGDCSVCGLEQCFLLGEGGRGKV